MKISLIVCVNLGFAKQYSNLFAFIGECVCKNTVINNSLVCADAH